MELNPLQNKLKEMFGWFHNFCQEHGLRYYALGGTMLGAARHEGFIPWDDDVDVGMPRKDYILLASLLKNQKGRYVLEMPDSPNDDYVYPFAKLYDTETTLIENTRSKIKRGIYLDIFPLDGAGEDYRESYRLFKKIYAKRMLTLAATTGYRQGRRFYKNAMVLWMQLIPDWLICRKKMVRNLDEMCAHKDYDTSSWIGNFMGNWKEREIMPRSVMGVPTEYRFESMTIWGPENYDDYLTRLYGDWHKLPPIEKRVSHHDFVYINIEESYLK